MLIEFTHLYEHESVSVLQCLKQRDAQSASRTHMLLINRVYRVYRVYREYRIYRMYRIYRYCLQVKSNALVYTCVSDVADLNLSRTQ